MAPHAAHMMRQRGAEPARSNAIDGDTKIPEPANTPTAVRYSTVVLHLSGLFGTASHPDMKEIRINGFFFENRLNWQFEVKKKILQMAVLDYIFIYEQIKH
jgi:hypothetical protein